MSHPNQLTFVKHCSGILESVYKDASIAEIGAYAVNGGIRNYFGWGGKYTGVDLVAGPGVDVVASGHDFGESNAYDIVISSEMFEHNPLWLETFLNMIRMTKSGGTMLFTCATMGRIEHGTDRTGPEDSPGTSARGWQYYRNLTRRDFEKHIDVSAHFSCFRFFNVAVSNDLYFIGTKKAYGPRHEESWLECHVDSLSQLVDSLNSQKDQGPQSRYPVLRAIRMLPVKVAAHLLPESLYQNFALSYLRCTEIFGK